MAVNQVLYAVEAVNVVSATLTLGYGPGQTVPSRYIICNPTANMTITLPLSTAQLPTSSSTQYIPGTGPGFPITIININSGGFTVAVAAATGDTLLNIPATLATQNSSIEVFSDSVNTRWIGLRSATSGQIVEQANGLGASTTSFTLLTATSPIIETGVSAVFGTASTSGTLQVEKATGTQAVGSGTNTLTGTISLSGTANTVVNGTLVATAATLAYAVGNRCNLIFAGTMTSLANCNVTVSFSAQ
jgi:hypothetical protein